jgi:hypothetical protein
MKSNTTIRRIAHIEVSGRATLYAGYEDFFYADIKDAFSKMTPKEREEIDYDKLCEISSPDEFYEDMYDGWSFDNNDLYIRVIFDDGEIKEYNGMTLTEEEGKTVNPIITPIRCSYTKFICSTYIEDDEPIEIKGDFDISKLHFVLNHYTVNGKAFTTCAELKYKGVPILFSTAQEGGDEKWAEIEFQFEGENYLF